MDNSNCFTPVLCLFTLDRYSVYVDLYWLAGKWSLTKRGMFLFKTWNQGKCADEINIFSFLYAYIRCNNSYTNTMNHLLLINFKLFSKLIDVTTVRSSIIEVNSDHFILLYPCTLHTDFTLHKLKIFFLRIMKFC